LGEERAWSDRHGQPRRGAGTNKTPSIHVRSKHGSALGGNQQFVNKGTASGQAVSTAAIWSRAAPSQDNSLAHVLKWATCSIETAQPVLTASMTYPGAISARAEDALKRRVT
jgi:hypothetical protein